MAIFELSVENKQQLISLELRLFLNLSLILIEKIVVLAYVSINTHYGKLLPSILKTRNYIYESAVIRPFECRMNSDPFMQRRFPVDGNAMQYLRMKSFM